MPYTEITQLYNHLLNVVPEHMSALNICLVKGGLRPATLIEPDNLRGISVDTDTTSYICENAGLETDLWGTTRLGPMLLVWDPQHQSLIDRLYHNATNDELFGEILGYRCLGDLNRKTLVYHHVDFAIRNPQTGNPNPFLSYICNSMGLLFQQTLRDQAEIYRDFIVYHRIANGLRLHVWTNTGLDIIDEWI